MATLERHLISANVDSMRTVATASDRAGVYRVGASERTIGVEVLEKAATSTARQVCGGGSKRRGKPPYTQDRYNTPCGKERQSTTHKILSTPAVT